MVMDEFHGPYDVIGQCPKCGGNLAACMDNGCPNDPKPLPEIENLRAENYRLKAKLAAAQQRLAEAEGLFNELKTFIGSEDVKLQVHDLPTEFKAYGIFQKIDSFLAHAPSDFVMIRRDDLSLALKHLWDIDFIERTGGNATYDRLKAAYKEGGDE